MINMAAFVVYICRYSYLCTMPEHGFQPIQGAQPYPGTMAAGCPFAGQCARSTPRCREAGEVPLRSWQGGMVRCLNPQTEE